jgi:general stress protein YciG
MAGDNKGFTPTDDTKHKDMTDKGGKPQGTGYKPGNLAEDRPKTGEAGKKEDERGYAGGNS